MDYLHFDYCIYDFFIFISILILQLSPILSHISGGKADPDSDVDIQTINNVISITSFLKAWRLPNPVLHLYKSVDLFIFNYTF